MELFLDIGNSRLKGALRNEEEMTYLSPALHRGNSVPDMMQSLCLPNAIQRVVISSVAADVLNRRVAEWIYQHYQLAAEFLHTQSCCYGLKNAYDEPDKLGVDRWLAMLAGWHRYRRLLCVVDCGSAMTIDLISKDGHHLGGMIIPGLSMQRKMTEDELSKVLSQPSDTNITVWGKDTASCLASGTMMSLVGAITLALRKAMRVYDDAPQLVITGGDAPTIMPWLEMPYLYHENLVIEGIVLMTDRVHGRD